MKSPTASVGLIDDDGILNGSATNERSRNTTSRTGKNDFAYSTQIGSREPGARVASRNTRSASHARPVMEVRTNRMRAKSIGGGSCRGSVVIGWNGGTGGRELRRPVLSHAASRAPAAPGPSPRSRKGGVDEASLAPHLQHGEECLLG